MGVTSSLPCLFYLLLLLFFKFFFLLFYLKADCVIFASRCSCGGARRVICTHSPLLRRDTDKESETVRPNLKGIDVVPSQYILIISSLYDPRTTLHFALPQSLGLMLVTKQHCLKKASHWGSILR